MKAFISYSHRDTIALENLHKHLAVLKRDRLIEAWYDREILAGGMVDREIDKQLENSGLFLAMVSPDFLNSDYCVEREMQKAIDRHNKGKMRIIPIVIEPCDWKASQLSQFKALPKDGKPISDWENPNHAYLDIVTELRRIIISEKSKEEFDMPIIGELQAQPTQERYRMRRDFDEIDRGEFCESAFQVISDFFRQSILEINDIEGVRGRFSATGMQSFNCTLINNLLRQGGESHISVRHGKGTFGIGDISYSFQKNSSANSANGWFSVESTDYELLLRWNSFDFSNDDNLMPPHRAAEELWKEFLGKVGISDE